MNTIKNLIIGLWIYIIIISDAFAQITISISNIRNLWSADKEVFYYEGPSFSNINVGKTGGPNIYDFSNISFFNPGAVTVWKISTIPQLSSRFPDTAMTFGDSPLSIMNNPVFLVDEYVWGQLATVTVLPDSQRYCHYVPMINTWGTFPLTYGPTFSFSCRSYDTTYVNGLPIRLIDSTLSGTVSFDGYGTLRIPGYNFECLRLKYLENNAGIQNKEFQFLTREGAYLWVECDPGEPDTGNINAIRCTYLLSETIVGKAEKLKDPYNFKLFQNYPNPFNPTTTIEYNIPNRGNVEIRIFNSVGELIKTLLTTEKDAGNYFVVWDGKNNSGNLVSSGVYFYQIKSGSLLQTKKMLLLK
jgi:hypothetical protein